MLPPPAPVVLGLSSGAWGLSVEDCLDDSQVRDNGRQEEVGGGVRRLVVQGGPVVH